MISANGFATFEISYKERGSFAPSYPIKSVIMKVDHGEYLANVEEVYKRTDEQLLLIESDPSKANFVRLPLSILPSLALDAIDTEGERHSVDIAKMAEPFHEGVCYRIGVVNEGDNLFASLQKVDLVARSQATASKRTKIATE